MKFAIFGDIHANLEGLEAVLEDAEKQGCTHYICIGDIVGYNANPRECLQRVKELKGPVIKGNHDEEASIDTPLENLNPLAEASMQWTRDTLTPEDKEWLVNLPFTKKVRKFTIVHATLDTPEHWGYVMNKFDALASLSYQFTPVCFYGHTHQPVVYAQGNDLEILREERIVLKAGKKYFINVGSAGQPRDGDWRVSYSIYDDETGTIFNRRLEYDIKKAQKKIIDAGLPEMLASRLEVGK